MKGFLFFICAILGIYASYIIGYFLGIDPRLFTITLLPVYFGCVYLYLSNKSDPEEMTFKEEQYLKASFTMFVYMTIVVILMWLFFLVSDISVTI